MSTITVTIIETARPGWVCGVDLAADQMRVIGDYCLRMAERMEKR